MDLGLSPVRSVEDPPAVRPQDVGRAGPNTVLRIQPSRGLIAFRFRELWEYRELLGFLVWRDLKIRYKQTALGATWAIIQPVLTMLIFSLFFGRLAKMPSEGLPYPVFAFAGLLPWTLFTYGLTQCSASLVSSSNLIKKVYFPRLVIPIASVLAGLPDFGLSLLVFGALAAYYKIVPQAAALLWLPSALLLTVVTSLGVGLWLAALNVRYRDVRYVVPFLTQVWMFATPIAYPATLLSEKARLIYSLNPMVGVVEGFRWALLKAGSPPPLGMIGVSAAVAVVVLVTGAFYFRQVERTFADVI